MNTACEFNSLIRNEAGRPCSFPLALAYHSPKISGTGPLAQKAQGHHATSQPKPCKPVAPSMSGATFVCDTQQMEAQAVGAGILNKYLAGFSMVQISA